MSSILSASGFNHLESLQEFATRFPNVKTSLDEDLQKIWICHKNSEEIPKFEDVNFLQAEDYFSLFKYIKRKIAAEDQFLSLLTQFSAVSIFDKIYSHFGSCLTSYIFNKCYVFYNWGINALEPLIDHFEIHKKIDEMQKSSVKGNQNIKNCHLEKQKVLQNTTDKNDETENSVDLFEEPVGKGSSNYRPRKPVHFRSVNHIYQKHEKFFDVARNARNPYQERFGLKSVLYDMKQRPQWPINHVLHKKDVDELLVFIINIAPKSDAFVKMHLNDQKNWLSLRSLLTNFINKHATLDKNNGYGRILKCHLRKGNNKPSAQRLLPIPKSIIAAYIGDILRKALPVELFGGSSIRKKFFSGLKKIINGTMGENFTWQQLLGVLVRNKSKLSWCREMNNYCAQTEIILKLFKFIVVHYIFIVIRNNFYVTETGSSGYALKFYRKGDMESATTACLRTLLFYKHIKLHKKGDHDIFSVERKWLDTGIIDKVDLKRKSMKTMAPGTEYKQMVASVRFLPKNEHSNDLRLITNINVKHIRTQNGRNQKLIKLFATRGAWREKKLFFLRLLLDFLVEKIGFGIKPLPNNPKLESAWNKAIQLKENFGKLYFVKADIAEAFDSVRHDILIEIIQRAFDEESRRETIQLRRIIEWEKTKGKIKKVARFSFCNRPKENSLMINRSAFLHHKIKLKQHYDPGFIDILKQVVTEQRIEIKGKIYKLTKGLAQGSAGKFSPKLCEIYYSSMDKLYFADFANSRTSILLRGVDDYLFITSDPDKGKTFLDFIRRGIEHYNVRFNKNKLKSNLIEDIREVSYLGLIFNFDDMSVRPNYSKYHGRDLLSTMNLSDKWGNNHFNKDLFLERRSLRLNSLKLQPILLSKNHNSLRIIRQTVFQACLLQATRIKTLANYLYSGKNKNDVVVFKVLCKSCNKIKKQVSRICYLSKDEIKWLFLFAALSIFRKGSGQFKALLVIIRYNFQKSERTFVDSGTELFLNLLKDDILDVEFWNGVQYTFGKIENKS